MAHEKIRGHDIVCMARKRTHTFVLIQIYRVSTQRQQKLYEPLLPTSSDKNINPIAIPNQQLLKYPPPAKKRLSHKNIFHAPYKLRLYNNF